MQGTEIQLPGHLEMAVKPCAKIHKTALESFSDFPYDFISASAVRPEGMFSHTFMLFNFSL